MIRNEKHPFPAPGNIVPSPHARKIEREAEKQKGDEAGENHGNVRGPDPQTREYSFELPGKVFALRISDSHFQMLVTGHSETP
jgi:hypothetical protein